MGRKRIKSNKYQLKSNLTRSIWLEEDDPKSNWLNSDFGESNRLTEINKDIVEIRRSKRKSN